MSSADTSHLDYELPNFFNGRDKRHLIDGKWVESLSGDTFASIDPANEKLIARAAAGSKEDVDLAVTSARKAFEDGSWANLDAHERSNLLFRVADLIEQNVAEIAEIESIDAGMPLSTAKRFVASSARTFRYYAGWCTKIHGGTNPSGRDVFNYTLREPVGVCGQIVPWNTPFSMAVWKVAPALACGNTSILKPAEQTPFTALRLGELVLEAGVPPGVLNIVTGLGHVTGAAIVEHPGIDKIAFTGSTEVGKLIVRSAAGNLKRVTLELGGKSPNIIFQDADMESALSTTLNGFCQMAGQMCVASSRIFVHQSIYDEFLQRLSALAGAIRVGDPLRDDTQMGPLVSREQFERVTSYFSIGLNEGAKIHTGGTRIGNLGYFVQPTVFGSANNDMRIAREEIFGPVTAVMPFEDEEEAIRLGNDTQFGLAAAVWTRDVGRAHRMARALKSGTIWINTCLLGDQSSPFGGYKQSGMGREMGSASLDAYTEIKSVFLKL